MAELIVVTGPPGAGKSTVSPLLSARYEDSACVAGDAFFRFLDRGYLAPWTSAAHEQNTVVVSAAAAVGRLVQGGYTVVYDGVIGPWLVNSFARETGLFCLHYAVLLPPEVVCLDRVAARAPHGLVDPDATRHMYAEFARAEVESRHLLHEPADAPTLAARIFHLVESGSIERRTGAGGE